MNNDLNVEPDENSKIIYAAVEAIVNDILSSSISAEAEPVHDENSPASSWNTDQNHSIQNSTRKYRDSSTVNLICQSTVKERKPTYEIYRAMQQFYESKSDINLKFLQNRQTQTLELPFLPPSYSTVIKQVRPSLNIRRDFSSAESPFYNTRRIPPPPYGGIQGVWSRDVLSTASSEQGLLGPEPTYIWCNRCRTMIITATQSQQSKLTHVAAAALCLIGCWPCAILPYFITSCKNVTHHCPHCHYMFGIYTPW